MVNIGSKSEKKKKTFERSPNLKCHFEHHETAIFVGEKYSLMSTIPMIQPKK